MIISIVLPKTQQITGGLWLITDNIGDAFCGIERVILWRWWFRNTAVRLLVR